MVERNGATGTESVKDGEHEETHSAEGGSHGDLSHFRRMKRTIVP